MNEVKLVAWDFFGVITASPDVEVVLKVVQEAGAHQIIVSHSSSYDISSYLEKYHLSPYIQHIYGSDWHLKDSKLGKVPALQDYISTNGPFALQLMVGDSWADIEDGAAAGMKTCLLDLNGHYRNAGDGVDYIISDLHEVVSIVGSHPAVQEIYDETR